MKRTDHGTQCKDDEFAFTVQRIVEEYPVTHVIETGTFNGLGSTLIFAQHLPVYTIESNAERAEQAEENLKDYAVEVYCGLSLTMYELRKAVKDTCTFPFPETVMCDGKSDPFRFYLAELARNSAGAMNYLPHLLRKRGFPIIFLDSCGGTGYAEFQYVMKHAKRPFILMLDDCNHVKHYRSVREMGNPHFFCDGRCAWEYVE